MEELKNGYVPSEIRSKFKGPANVGLEDKRKDTYTPPPPPKYVAYSGAGQSMGASESLALDLNMSAEGPKIDVTQPTTTIQIRFHNGQKKAVKFHLTHTVGDIHAYVMMAAPVDGSYELIAGFPPKPLDNPSLSIKDAGLSGAVITQKLG